MSQKSVERVIGKFGTQERLAELLRCDQTTVSKWKTTGFIPARRQRQILDAARELGIDLEPNDFFDISGEAAA